jgi:ATP-independent RNA helicase DbpA
MKTKRLTNEQILKNLEINTLNEMQNASIDALLAEKDVILLAPTGSGKTIGFLLPLLELLDQEIIDIQALIIAPSRELVLQIENVFKQMRSGFKVNSCYGGHSIKIEINNLSVPPAVLIGTPGRIDDLLKRRILNLKHVKSLVLDEFDKSLEMGFHEEMSYIIDKLKTIKIRFLTSATNLIEIPEFVGIKSPVRLNYLDISKTNAKLEVKMVKADEQDKLETLFKLICKLGNQSMLIFVNQRDSVERICEFLTEKGIVTSFFHGGLEQLERERTLTKFRNGSSQILITTDLTSRGLDIPEIESIIHYNLPQNLEAYTHRNGRTARMNAIGAAYLIVDKEETLPEFIKTKITVENLPKSGIIPTKPKWETLYIGKGKKDKINKTDILGFLCKIGKLDNADVGLIEVKDIFSYVAVRSDKIQALIKLVKNEKLKNQKAKIELAK